MALILITYLTDKSKVTLSQLIVDPQAQGIKMSGTSSYIFSSAANVVQKALTHVPNPFYRDFAIVFHFHASSAAAAVLFSITDESEKLMYIGLKLGAVQSGRQKVQFFYTESGSETSNEAASFDIPSRQHMFYTLGLTVTEDQVTLYLDCNQDPQVMKFQRSPDPIVLSEDAKIFVGQAGNADPDKFEVIYV